MGIHGILPYLPGGRHYLRSFASLQMQGKQVNIDAGGLCYACAYQNADDYIRGDYMTSLKSFFKLLNHFSYVLKWDILIVFDGVEPKEKAAEERRRREAAEKARLEGKINGQLKVTSTFIALCALICRQQFVKFIVSPLEADMQVVKSRPDALVLTGDSDIIAFGRRKVVIVKSWFMEEFRIIDLDADVSLPLMKHNLKPHIHKYGQVVIYAWAAVMGCDVTENKNGIDNIGAESFFAALDKIERDNVSSFSLSTFASALLECNLRSTSATLAEIKQQLCNVKKWFTSGGRYYDDYGCVCASASNKVLQKSSLMMKEHMKGRRDPKTVEPFSAAQKDSLSKLVSSDLLHVSSVPLEDVQGTSLPPGRSSVDDCIVEELKPMVYARGGSCTDHNGKGLVSTELKKVVTAYLSIEEEVPSHSRVYFDRNRTTTGVFSRVNTNHGRPVLSILNSLLALPSMRATRTRTLLEDARDLLDQKKFTTDFDKIVAEAPELHDWLIYREFAHIGQSTKQKTVSVALQRTLDMDDIIYHANATKTYKDGRRSLLVISKQEASMTKDQKTRKETPMGEKPLPVEYLVVIRFGVGETSYATDGHTLGFITNIEEAFCGQCIAGMSGRCIHIAKTAWLQYHHWGEGRPTAQPKTQKLCGFLRRGTRRNSCVNDCASSLMCVKLPKTLEEAEYRAEHGSQRNATEGIDCRYDVYKGNDVKRAKLSNGHMFSMERPAVQRLFKELRNANKNRKRKFRPWERR